MANVLAFVDFTPSSAVVVRLAREIAASFGMKLILMHVSTPHAYAEEGQIREDISPKAVAAEMRRYHRDLEILAKQCEKEGIDTKTLLVPGHSLRGNPVPGMVKELNRVNPSLVVMGTHQHSRLFEAVFSSASSKVVHHSKCPVLLVPSGMKSAKWAQRAAKT